MLPTVYVSFLNCAVVVAVAAMRVMQVSADEIIRVVTVRHCFVATFGAVLVVVSVAFAAVAGRACIRIGLRNRQRMLIVVPCMLMVKVPVVQVVGMVTVLDSSMTAVRPVLVVVIPVCVMVRHVEGCLVGHLEVRCTSQALALFSS